MSIRALIVASLLAALAGAGLLASDYARQVREIKKVQRTIDARNDELRGMFAISKEVEHYTSQKELLQKKIDIVNHAVLSQTNWQPGLEFVERAIKIPGLRIDRAVIADKIDLDIHADSPQKLAEAARAVQAMTIDLSVHQYDDVTFYKLKPVFVRQPNDLHWTIRLDGGPKQ